MIHIDDYDKKKVPPLFFLVDKQSLEANVALPL